MTTGFLGALATSALIIVVVTVAAGTLPGRIDGHLSAEYVGKLIAAAMPGVWTMHTLRHRFATLFRTSPVHLARDEPALARIGTIAARGPSYMAANP